MFSLELSSHAIRFLNKADKALTKRIMERLKRLTENPYPSEMVRIENRKEKVYRIRVGDYRVLYTADLPTIYILDIDKRESIYHK